MYEYDATVNKVHDGDTLHASIDLGFNVFLNSWVRLEGLETPELGTVKEPILEGEQSTLVLMGLLGDREIFSERRARAPFGRLGPYLVVGEKPTIRIRTKLSNSTEKYGRVLGTIHTRSGKTVNPASVNSQMLVLGAAEPSHYELKM